MYAVLQVWEESSEESSFVAEKLANKSDGAVVSVDHALCNRKALHDSLC